MSSNHTPPIVPHVLHVSDQRNPWKLAPIERLKTRYHTPTTVATEFGTVDHTVRRAAGKSGVTKQQGHVWCLADEQAWDRAQAGQQRMQQLLDLLADELRLLGTYASRLEKAGGIKKAPNPLTPWVIGAPDPDDTGSYWYANPVPHIDRKPVTSHTPKMLRGPSNYGNFEHTFSQGHQFVCPSDEHWTVIEKRLADVKAAHDDWQKLLRELGTYDQALADGRYTKTAQQAPLELAAPPAPSMFTTAQLTETDLTPALVSQLNEAGYLWISATRTPDGYWHHLIEPRESWARIGSRRRMRPERLEQLLANAEPAPAAIAVVEAVAVGVAMMGRDEAQALVTRIKRNLDGMRVDLLELYEREGWKALGYPSWRECAVAEFGASAATLYRQLEAAEIERDVRGGDFSQVEKTIPTVQLQAVKDLSPAERRQAFERADELAGERPRTAADVRQAAAEIKPPAAKVETDDELYTRRARKILDTLDQWDDREHARLLQEAYSHARQIRDEGAYRAMMSAIDRAVEYSGQPKTATKPTPAAAMIAADLPLAEPAPAARADWWNIGEHTRALQKAIDHASRNDAIRAAQKLLAELLYSDAPARPRRPASADVSAQTRYMADLEQYAIVLEIRLGAVQTFAQPAAPVEAEEVAA